jgi:hypothetical protein
VQLRLRKSVGDQLGCRDGVGGAVIPELGRFCECRERCPLGLGEGPSGRIDRLLAWQFGF